MTMYCRKERAMLSVNILLTVFLSVSVMLALFMAWRNHKRFKENEFVADELDNILRGALETLKATKGKGGSHLRGAIKKKSAEDEAEDLNSPDMLSTLLTVIVHKYGQARLCVDDFKNVADDEFVSIYVDTTTNELILSLNHHLQDGEPVVMPGFKSDNDDTFH